MARGGLDNKLIVHVKQLSSGRVETDCYQSQMGPCKRVSDSHTGMPLNNYENSIAEDYHNPLWVCSTKNPEGSVSCQGIAFTGIQAKMTLHPAAANTGIVFVVPILEKMRMWTLPGEM